MLRKLIVLAAVGLIAFGAMGQWVDEIVLTQEPSTSAAIAQLAADAIDVYAFAIGDRALFATVLANPDLKSYQNFGSFNDLTMNHSGDQVILPNGDFNPFGDPKIREAMHWLIDREYIAQGIMGGLAVPKYTYINSAFPDAARYPDLIADMEDKYAYNFAKAEQVITERMLAHGATKIGGKWAYQGKVIELRFLIRTEDERKEIGDYISDQLEKVGFSVIRQYGLSRELSPLWISSNPLDGLWHLYTGGWVSTVISRDMGTGFNQFYTDRVLPWPLFASLATATTDPVLYEVTDKLATRNYSSMAEREKLFIEAVTRSNAYANIIWLVDRTGFSPVRANVAVAADLAGGIYGSHIWAHTLQFQVEGEPQVGGRMRVATSTLFIEPWNPIAGSNWVYDMIPIRATADAGTFPDTKTGLVWPNQFEKAEIYIQTGLPCAKDPASDWLTLEFVDAIEVPADAWADWDPVTQTFITVGQKYPDGVTDARRKSVVYYAPETFERKLHDGSKLSIGDFILGIILTFDRAKPESKIYDEAAVAGYKLFMAHFRGVKVITDDPTYPLIIETYSTLFTLDAEIGVSTWFPYYAQGPGFWHVLTLGIMAEENKELAFSSDKSKLLGVEWTNLIDGPSLPILAKYLDQAVLTGYIPYKPTLGKYITPAEAVGRWANLDLWYSTMGHFWVANGPYYLAQFDAVAKNILLKRFPDYSFTGERMQFLVD